jgi:hypothetical protein
MFKACLEEGRKKKRKYLQRHVKRRPKGIEGISFEACLEKGK